MPRRFPARQYLDRRMGVLLGLGFASGLPSAYRLLGSTLQAWLADLGTGVEALGLFALVTLPFAFNFVWAPLLDRFAPPVLGRRRGWLLLLQFALALAILALAAAGPAAAGDSLVPLAVACLVVALLAASQDVVADAYRTDVLEPAERGAGAAMFVNGYRVALIVAGGGALLLAEYLPWRLVYVVLAAFMGVGVAATLLARPAPDEGAGPRSLREALVDPARDFVRRLGPGIGAVLLFVVLFKLPDAMAAQMTMPLLTQGLGFAKAEVAWIREWLGLLFAMAGALLGGPLLARLGLRRSLYLFGAVQALSNLGFSLLAEVGADRGLLAAVVVVENLGQGLATAGFMAYLMSVCNRRHSATQYALFTSLMFLTATLAGAATGFLVAAVGFTAFFALTVAAGLPGMLLVPALPMAEEEG